MTKFCMGNQHHDVHINNRSWKHNAQQKDKIYHSLYIIPYPTKINTVLIGICTATYVIITVYCSKILYKYTAQHAILRKSFIQEIQEGHTGRYGCHFKMLQDLDSTKMYILFFRNHSTMSSNSLYVVYENQNITIFPHKNACFRSFILFYQSHFFLTWLKLLSMFIVYCCITSTALAISPHQVPEHYSS